MRKVLFFHFLFLLPIFSPAQGPYPILTEIVTDRAGIFNADQLQGLRTKLTDFETATSNQVVVLSIGSLGNHSIEEYALGVFNQNDLGQQGKDNGILILFSKGDREVRIEVGYGLEDHITDAVASRIIRNTMLPRFKEEQYFIGIDGATDELIEYLGDPQALAAFKHTIEQEAKLPWWAYIILGLMLSAFIGVGGFVFYQGQSRLVELLRGAMIGKLGILPALPMGLVSLLMIGFGLIFILVPVLFSGMIFDLESMFMALDPSPSWALYFLGGFFLLTVLLAAAKIMIKGDRDLKISWLKSDSTYMAKTFSSSGSHSFGSGSSSSGGSSSSFSGGGGSSGGGGASGSW